MRLRRPSPPEHAAHASAQLPYFLLTLLAFAPIQIHAADATELDCARVEVGDHAYDLSALKGPHSVVTSKHHAPSFTNTTWTLDLCGPLKRAGEVDEGMGCPDGTRVCAIRHLITAESDVVQEVIPIAGDLSEYGGKAFTYEATRIGNSSDERSDSSAKDGVRLVLKGGSYEEKPQQAVVELVCDEKRTGLEDEWESEDKYERRRRADDDEDKDGQEPKISPGSEEQLSKGDPSLVWNSYGRVSGSEEYVLHLTWNTKYACRSVPEGDGKDGEKEGDPAAKKGWGFFTWIIIMGFLATATYLIFGSWLNYTRYGARGWDLLPHGDTLRDVPYLLKDWTRRVLNTVQGSGSRGGYSAL